MRFERSSVRTSDEIAACVVRGKRPAVNAPADSETPRRTRRDRSCVRARDRRAQIVPAGQPRSWAAASVDKPSRWQSTTGVR